MATETRILAQADENKMPLSEKLTFGFGNLAANLMLTTASSFITYYYTDVVGLSAVIVGNILLWARLFDGASDLAMGAIVDKTRSKHGKARPWILWMAIPYALAMILLFTSPDFLVSTGKAIYAFVTYVIALAGVYTATMVPYNAMIGTTTLNPVDRGNLSTSRTLAGFVGAMGVTAVVLPVVNFFGGDKQAWTWMAAVFGVISTVLLLILFKNSKERVSEATVAVEKVPLKTNIKALFQNKYWIIMILYMMIGFITSGLGGINIFYAQWILGDPAKVAVIGILSFMPIAVGAVFMPVLLSKFSKKMIVLVGSLVMLLGLAIIALFPENFTMIMIGLVIRGLGIAPGAVAGFAMLGDVADYGEWKTGIRSEGLIFSAGTFAEKVGSGVGGLILGVVLGLGGYVSQGATQSTEALFAIKAIFAYLPIAFTTICILLILFYDLDKKLPGIAEDLKAKRANG
ncbi:MFS transporter [Trichococcus flocculiformis]|uniref:MFS transporter n=1 Tax=Trichococcus flocculiformis TaxID=82803 RepID=UPI002AAACF29|nr:MFS transporter [Trichococcus flocculiformis]